MEHLTDQAQRNNPQPALDLARTLRHNPTQNYLYVLPLPSIEKSGQILIPNSAVKIIYEGHIVKVGPCVQDERYREGDVVIWNVHTETLLTIDGFPRFGCVPEGEIIGHIPRNQLLPTVAPVAKEPLKVDWDAFPQGGPPPAETAEQEKERNDNNTKDRFRK